MEITLQSLEIVDKFKNTKQIPGVIKKKYIVYISVQ